jgi:DNA-binding CsgD family transcriptional regulator
MTTLTQSQVPLTAARAAELELIEPLQVAAVAESAEAVIEGLDAPVAAAPAFFDLLVEADVEPDGSIALDEYAKAVLYNGLGHYQAARAAARRASERDDFALVDGALAELVEAAVRSGDRGCAEAASHRLEARARSSRSHWAQGLSACAEALLAGDDARAEGGYADAIGRLGCIRAQVATARVRLLFGEWLRRQGRRVDARAQLQPALRAFVEVGLGGFAERARRELLATCRTTRKRTDDARFDLTAQEARIAELAAGGCTNPEIGERLFISKRTVEWHLRKVFTKLGVSSRRELHTIASSLAPTVAPA